MMLVKTKMHSNKFSLQYLPKKAIKKRIPNKHRSNKYDKYRKQQK